MSAEWLLVLVIAVAGIVAIWKVPKSGRDSDLTDD
jgi:hypothetical protein